MATSKSFIQIAIDKKLKNYETESFMTKHVTDEELDNLEETLNYLIQGNEDKYKSQIDERMAIVRENINFVRMKAESKLRKKEIKNGFVFDDELEQDYNDLNSTPIDKFNEKNLPVVYSELEGKKYKLSKKNVFTGALAVTGLAVVIAFAANACSKKSNEFSVENKKIESEKLLNNLKDGIESGKNINLNKDIVDPAVNSVLFELEKKDTSLLDDFAKTTEENVSLAMNNLLSNGVRLITDKNVNEEELIAGLGLQYYFVANIDNITTLEYANFMKEMPNAVLDNDDLIYNFRNMNVLLKQQILVSRPDNKIDFSSIYTSEEDAKLLNDGADILARLNAATSKNDRKEISKEFYNYIQETLLDNTNDLSYSNSAMATFINSEFGAWCELTKSSGYKKGYYPDNELEAKLMTVVSNCGASKGEQTLDLTDETKKSLESINVIRVLDSLNSRKDNIQLQYEIGEIYYVDSASYGNLRETVKAQIDLSNYKELISYTEQVEEKILTSSSEKSKDDSGVSNGQGGVISSSQLEQYNINPSSPTAKEELEQSVKEEYEQKNESVITNGNGVVIDEQTAANWAQQGAIDAANGVRNNNVPSEYQNAYDNGWNAGNEAIQNVNTSSSTTFVPVSGEETVSETITENGFVNEQDTNNDQNINQTPSAPETNDNIESTTTFVPVDEVVEEEIIDETIIGFNNFDNEIIEEEVEVFTEPNFDQRTIEVKTLTRNEKVESYKKLKTLLQQAINSTTQTLYIYNEIETMENKRIK